MFKKLLNIHLFHLFTEGFRKGKLIMSFSQLTNVRKFLSRQKELKVS